MVEKHVRADHSNTGSTSLLAETAGSDAVSSVTLVAWREGGERILLRCPVKMMLERHTPAITSQFRQSERIIAGLDLVGDNPPLQRYDDAGVRPITKRFRQFRTFRVVAA
ncbi:MAG: hypothetical protein EB141_04165 [Verrucomicrobia bacterium]|nr:hypothetical protein [Verrucomicrobiota bacterium]NBU09336.1 hypothetical protein [Pseudomonadota bacterium]NDA65512.1 hypothetical protein [Verrucomicrobiota bacterium]NDB74832.1 hypothetical protein [Verrucomicrobiota bacterium]NDD37397.1 hypothetical protein [Verrucomicrobiota bacterium]